MQSDIQLKINFIKSTTLVSGKHGFKSQQSFSFFNSFFLTSSVKISSQLVLHLQVKISYISFNFLHVSFNHPASISMMPNFLPTLTRGTFFKNFEKGYSL